MYLRNLICRTTLALLACGGNAAMASVVGTTSSSITNIQFSSSDLRPLDGVAGGASIANDGGMLYYLLIPEAAPNSNAMLFPPAPITQSVSGAKGDLSAWASASQSLDIGAQLALAHNNSAAANTGAVAISVESFVITLLPHSSFTVTGHSHAEAALFGGIGLGGLAQATAEVDLFNPFDSYQEVWIYDAVHVKANGALSDGFDKDFTASLSNDTDQAVLLNLNIRVDGNGTNKGAVPPPVIPEPSSYAMLGMGLGVLAMLRRRRA
jgi:hypothetical protein